MPDLVDLEHDIGARCRPGDGELAALAARQHGVVASWQLDALGFGRGAIRHRRETGRLHPIHLGVYAVGHSALGGHGRWIAAVLAGGPCAVLSHRSAAALWDLRPTARGTVDVSAPGRSRRGQPGIAFHHVRRLEPQDRTRRDGIPVTTVARTLLDLAEVAPPGHLERAFEAAERLDLLDLGAIERLCCRSRGRRGLRVLRALLTQQTEPAPLTRSELEREFLDVCRDAGLRAPAVNVVVAGFEVDVVWPDHRLVVELDGYPFHRTAAAFERDRVRDAELQLAGYRVLRVTHRRLRAEPNAVTRTLRALLAAGSGQP